MTNDIEEVVFSSDYFTEDDWPPTDYKGFMKWFSDKEKEVPIRFRDSIKIKIGTYVEYGDYYESIEVTYRRPKTTKEKADARIVQNELKRRIKAWEKEEYERLKKKLNFT